MTSGIEGCLFLYLYQSQFPVDIFVHRNKELQTNLPFGYSPCGNKLLYASFHIKLDYGKTYPINYITQRFSSSQIRQLNQQFHQLIPIGTVYLVYLSVSGEIQRIQYIFSNKTKGFLLVIFGHFLVSRYYAYYVLPLFSGKYSFRGCYLIAFGIMTKSIRLRYFHKSEGVKISQLV